jgi:hypothetical protein
LNERRTSNNAVRLTGWLGAYIRGFLLLLLLLLLLACQQQQQQQQNRRGIVRPFRSSIVYALEA